MKTVDSTVEDVTNTVDEVVEAIEDNTIAVEVNTDAFESAKQSTISGLIGGISTSATTFQKLSEFNQLLNTFKTSSTTDSYRNLFSSASGFRGSLTYTDPLIETLKGLTLGSFSSGGYTGMGGKYELAGAVHKGEYVINQDQLRNVGGVNAVESFIQNGNNMRNEMRELIAYTRQLVDKNIELNRMFRNVSDGGNVMKMALVE